MKIACSFQQAFHYDMGSRDRIELLIRGFSINHPGFTELTLDQNFGNLNETQSEYLGDVLASSKHLLSLINDILDLSKIEAGKMEIDPSEVQLRLLLENSLIMIKEKALKHGINVAAIIENIPDTIQADERRVKQILYNLLSNAVKFTPDGGADSARGATCRPGCQASLQRELPNGTKNVG